LNEPEHAQTGQLAHLVSLVQTMRDELRKGEEWGGFGDAERLYFDPAGVGGPGGVGPTAEFMYDGTFVSIGIYNMSAGVLSVAFTPNLSGKDRTSLFNLSARCWIVLPYRGTTVSVSGAVAGSALIVPFDVPQRAAGGQF
jgi:hypothetical protein